jgi:Flp pilus assembly protein TadD
MNNPEPADLRPGNTASRAQHLLTVGILVVTACTGIMGTLAAPEAETDAGRAPPSGAAAKPEAAADAPPAEQTEAERKAEDEFVDRFRRAQQLMGRGDDERAEKLMRELISEKPMEAALHHALAVILQFRRRSDDAAESFLRASTLAPADPVIRRDTGLHLLAIGRVKDAETHLAAAAALWPEDVEAAVGHGAALRQLGRLPEAESSYRRAVASDANSVDAAVGLAACIVDTRPEEALKLVAPTAGQWPDLLLVRGTALTLLGRTSEAVPVLVKVSELAPRGAAGAPFLRGAAEALVRCGAAPEANAAAARWSALAAGTADAVAASTCLAVTCEALADHDGALRALADAQGAAKAPSDDCSRTTLLRAAVLVRAGRSADAKPVLESLLGVPGEPFERSAAMRLLGRLEKDDFARLGSAPGRANDVEWIESLAAEMAGDAAAATAARARAAAASTPRGEFPGLLVGAAGGK